ncbi:uncharacterized protein EV154DRAFT_502152 [Mucor mucedo]|uniref:uncharacterized protein n=1 Tax=Mucor mucedo TaxID=29922 RepID=UPI00222070F2|nr:uncharacterized protein EV154DRAFT_502152 [Mucor mucedo]KAI7893232.1 hypothetical protein EV154DRAFT_502152 [Mucor mucedo]
MSSLNMEDTIDDPSDFQSRSFQELDEHFRCHICKEFFDTTMILTTCSHSFCALCIRRSLNTEQNCPRCRTIAHEQNLIHNYDLDNAVTTWKASRLFLLNADKSIHTVTTCAPPHPNIVQPNTVQPTNVQIIDNENNYDDGDLSNDFKPLPTLKRPTSSRIPTTRRSTRLSSQTKTDTLSPHFVETPIEHDIELIDLDSQESSSSSSNKKEEVLTDLSIVECPICCQKMKYRVLNIHMDRCANGDSRIPPSSPIHSSISSMNITHTMEAPKMQIPAALKLQKPVNLGKKPNKLVYAMLSDKELRTILKDLNLPDYGDKAQKVWRHKEYITLYNANYDSDRPVSAPMLVQRLIAIENAQACDKNKRKATDPNEHREKYKSEFDLLIESAKIRKLSTKGKEPNKHDQ